MEPSSNPVFDIGRRRQNRHSEAPQQPSKAAHLGLKELWWSSAQVAQAAV
jgi:hypothetical protein